MGIDYEKVEHVYCQTKPNIDWTLKGTLQIGRVNLQVVDATQVLQGIDSSMHATSANFAITAHASRILERISASIFLNEPVSLLSLFYIHYIYIIYILLNIPSFFCCLQIF